MAGRFAVDGTDFCVHGFPCLCVSVAGDEGDQGLRRFHGGESAPLPAQGVHSPALRPVSGHGLDNTALFNGGQDGLVELYLSGDVRVDGQSEPWSPNAVEVLLVDCEKSWCSEPSHGSEHHEYRQTDLRKHR